MIQNYDAIVKSGVTWAKVKHLGWTKLNAIAGVLDEENADDWIEKASDCSRAEIKKLVEESLAKSAGRKPGGSTATQVKTFKFRADQIGKVQAAIDRAKKLNEVTDEAAALEVICQDYLNDSTSVASDAMAEFVADHISGLDTDARREFRNAVNARVGGREDAARRSASIW